MKFPREVICSFLAGMLSFWLGTVQFSLLYYPLHDFFGVHSEITTIISFAVYALVVICADRNNTDVEARRGSRYWFDELSCAVALQYIFLMVVVVVADPLSIVSESLHQPIGPCGEMEQVHTPAGLVLQRQKYLCTTRYDEKYFDFRCVPNGAPKQQDDGSGVLLPLEYYAVCGTSYENRAEYITVIWGCCILFGLFFYQMAACSGSTPVDPVKSRRRAVRSTSANAPAKSTLTMHTSSNGIEDLQHREPLISAKNTTDNTVILSKTEQSNAIRRAAIRLTHSPAQLNPHDVLLEPSASREIPKRFESGDTPHPKKRAVPIPPSTRVLRSRRYQTDN